MQDFSYRQARSCTRYGKGHNMATSRPGDRSNKGHVQVNEFFREHRMPVHFSILNMAARAS